MSEGQQRVSALRRQRALLQEQLRKAQEQVYRLSQEEEEQRSLTDKMQRVMAMELRDQEKGNTQRVVNEASRLVRLFTTGFSSETMEPCFMSRDAERIASQRTAQENLRSAIDTFVEHQVQAPLSKARLLQRAAHGDPSKPANGKNSAVGGSSSSSSGIGQPITDDPHTPGRESTARETTSATQPSIEEQAYESLRADLRRLQACDWLCAQQLVQARVRAARAKAREQALASRLHDPQHRNLDDVYRLTAERHAFIEQQTRTNQELREKLHALLREAQALQPTAVQVGSVDAHVRRQQFLLRKTRVALKHQRIERNIHATFHHMLRDVARLTRELETAQPMHS
ncbi:hypothetical protein PTSG_00733 [Salpingoeca rosetta]|uniref:DUF4201 domain-containing protein n=1 Tax=Salpingoeca rosetta (strain ATCC 50818 / BSB-021) TaxID=946362 RepID=F2TXB4_SALR5|nr:uncharacterized protein PTSG_00733 [Salpingoeca rosetta]EGD76023.1 hypothetical protein PTSG_00733 [Salpingoeca rosetta]|eukprot:XP_004998198.1 hypothetical protein PTSG_00733 [Salpingoeca rosetta]